MAKRKKILFYLGLIMVCLNSFVLTGFLSIVATTLGIALILYGAEAVDFI